MYSVAVGTSVKVKVALSALPVGLIRRGVAGVPATGRKCPCVGAHQCQGTVGSIARMLVWLSSLWAPITPHAAAPAAHLTHDDAIG